jgi:hypothetical protein
MYLYQSYNADIHFHTILVVCKSILRRFELHYLSSHLCYPPLLVSVGRLKRINLRGDKARAIWGTSVKSAVYIGHMRQLTRHHTRDGLVSLSVYIDTTHISMYNRVWLLTSRITTRNMQWYS